MVKEKINVHFSSKKSDWETPQWFFDRLNEIHHFTTDVCATKKNAKCERYYTKRDNCLIGTWEGVCWMNPPYGRKIGEFVKKASESGVKVVCLLPARTDTKWFHDHIYHNPKATFEFIKGRLKFMGAKDSAPFPSMIVIFNGSL